MVGLEGLRTVWSCSAHMWCIQGTSPCAHSTLGLSLPLALSLSFCPEKQPAFFSQRELRALCACSAAAFKFRSPSRVFTKGSRNSINLRGRAAEFGSVQPLSSVSGIQCHLTKAASNYIFLPRLLYPRWFLSSLAVCPVCDQRRCQMKCKICASQFYRKQGILIFNVLADLVCGNVDFEMEQCRCFCKVEVLDSLHRSNVTLFHAPFAPPAFTTSPCRFLWDAVAVTTNWQFPFHWCCGCNQPAFNLLFRQWYRKVPVSWGGFWYLQVFTKERKPHNFYLASHLTCHSFQWIHIFVGRRKSWSLLFIRFESGQEKVVVDGGSRVGWWW